MRAIVACILGSPGSFLVSGYETYPCLPSKLRGNPSLSNSCVLQSHRYGNIRHFTSHMMMI